MVAKDKVMAISNAPVAISFSYAGNPPVVTPKIIARITMKEKLDIIF